jgi:glyoxylase-like metal-dependent hydrolase (beta-lactamase superfamily II)
MKNPERRALWATASLLGALLAGCASTPAPDPAALMARAEAALGSASLRTLVVSGRGSGATFGQAWQPGNPWPALNYSVLTRAMNFDSGALREDFGRSRAEPNGGGALPLMGLGEQRATGLVREGLAWAPAAAGAPAGSGTPQPVAAQARMHDLWVGTPHGALKAAARYDAVAGTQRLDGESFSTLSFRVGGQFAAKLFINAAGLVTRVESTLPHPVLGDTPVVTEFSDYKPMAGGLNFPARIRTSQGNFPVLDWQVAEVKAGEAVDIVVPDNVRSARENVAVQQVAEGVWFLAGGSHNSVAIELAEQIVLVEAPLYDGRTVAVLDAANALVPGKTVKTVINSHHHFDHAGGLRAAAASGAVLVTSAVARPYFERVFANPNSVAPDRLAQSGRKPSFIGVDGKLVLRDATRPVEIHELQGSVHATGFMMVWLPRERLLIQGDAFTPGPPGSAPPPVPNANHVNLVQNIERLGLDVDRILPLHSRVVPMSELLAQIGRR